MSEFFNIDYNSWNDVKAKEIAKSVDNDNVKGLSQKEFIEFFKSAKEEGIETADIYNLLGVELSKTTPLKQSRVQASGDTQQTYDIKALVDYFNSLDYYGSNGNDRSTILQNAQNKASEKLYVLEQDINNAFVASGAYDRVGTIPNKYEDTWFFDFEGVHDDITATLNNLNNLRDAIEHAYDRAKSKTPPTEAVKPDYDAKMKEFAQTYLGTDYETFIKENDLEFTKSITRAESIDPNYENAVLYGKARNYIKAIRRFTRDELQKVRTDSGERLLEETTNYSDSVVEMLDFDYGDISTDTVKNMKSQVMSSAFLEAVNDSYKTTGIDEVSASDDEKTLKDGKYLKNGKIIIVKDGKTYNINGTAQ